MEGKALSWFQALCNTHNLSSWNEFLVGIQVRFGKGSYDDPMEEFQALCNTHNLSSWNEFLVGIQVRFGKGSYDDPMEALSKLKQTSSLEEYKTQFELLANRVLRLIDSHKLNMFLEGLRDDIRLPVRMFNPKTLNDHMR
jgi:hypothetical protein